MFKQVNSQGGSAKVVWIIIVLIAAVIIGYLAFGRNNEATEYGSEQSMVPTTEATVTVAPTSSPTPVSSSIVKPTATPKNSSQPSLRTFNISGKSFSFSPAEIRVKKGDTVKIIFNNTEGLHDWVIDEFNAKTPRVQAGQSATVSFVADKTGTFEYYCSVGSHRAQGMVGNLIVQ